MVLSNTDKLKIINEFQINSKDTGSSFVQIALLTAKINDLMEHLKKNKGDKHSRRGLLKIVSVRKKFLKYIKNKSETEYTVLIKKLSIRK